MTDPRRRRFNPIVLLPLVPVVALLASVYLPFVNQDSLWFGVPSLFVWTSVWVLLITPALWLVERTLHRADDDSPERHR